MFYPELYIEHIRNHCMRDARISCHPQIRGYLAQGLFGSALEISWGLTYEGCVHRKTLRMRFSMLICIKSELMMKMRSAPSQHREWLMHISSALEPLATLSGDAKKLLIMSKGHSLVIVTLDIKKWTINTPRCFSWYKSVWNGSESTTKTMVALALFEDIANWAVYRGGLAQRLH